MTDDVIVDMQEVVKNFPGVKALDRVSFNLHKGEIHVLVGENGAGKSTLVKILAGILPLDHGSICLNGDPVRIGSPRHAQGLGIGILYQESNLSPYLTVAQNIHLCHEPIRLGFMIDVGEETRRARDLLDSLSINVDPQELVANLSLGKQQLIVFARAVSFNPRVLILDEPTRGIDVGSKGVLHWAGIAVFKKAYGVFQECQYRSRLIAVAHRHYRHWSELIGGDVILTIPYEWQKLFNASDIEVKERIANPVPPEVVETLYHQFADFRRAYDEGGMNPSEFDSYGPTLRTLRAFIASYRDLAALVRDFMLPNPDVM